MNASNNNDINILNLPDEILLTIISKLNMVDVLYSLLDVNTIFDRLILDSRYIHHLDLTANTLINENSSVHNQIFDRIRTKILPRIHHKVNKLTVESPFMEFIFDTVDYPQLHSLSLVNFQQQTLLQYLTGDTIFSRVLTDQITHLEVEIEDGIIVKLPNENESNLFALILSLGKCLKDLTISQFLYDGSLKDPTFNLASAHHISFSLTQLKIDVATFDDCLYILDGHFECLSTLIIDIVEISDSSYINKTSKLPKLKRFSLISLSVTYVYDKRIVPLLCRMLNLEELTLFISVIRINLPYIDGTHLYNDILIHMPLINKFIFSINTHVLNRDSVKIDLPTNNDIQNSFIEIGYQQVDSYADVKLSNIGARCHVYSLPYEFDTFYDLTNSLRRGNFDKVRWLVMHDIHPFEHEFFKIISQDFPFLQQLSVVNFEPQKNKQHSSALITFAQLDELNLMCTHIDYVQQFLVETNTRLPRLTTLAIEYEPLAIVTNNFTNDATRFNCSQLRSIFICEPFVRPENFHSYFISL